MSVLKKIENRSWLLKNPLKKNWFFLAFFMAIALLDTQCASMQQPTGGPRDSIPPKVLAESPQNLTRNFAEKEVVITFDEFIKLQNEFKEISVSPDMEKRPLFKVKKRNLVITMPDSLEENTTYTLNFGKGLGDYNEGNALLNYSYVFATGTEIDSLNVSGTVVDARTMEKEEEVTVMLIPTSQDTLFGKKKANIFTLTDSAGRFQLKNLKEQAYRIYALKEQNNDRIYNSTEEEIGFLDSSFYLDKDTSGIQLFISRGIPKDFRLLDRKIENTGRIGYAFNKPLEKPTIRILIPENEDSHKIIHYSSRKDSASMWIQRMDFDSLKVVIEEDGVPLDTSVIKRSKNDKYEREINLTTNLGRRKVDRIRQVQMVSSSPISKINAQDILLTEDSIPRTNFSLQIDSLDNRKFKLSYRWRAKRNYVLEIKEGAIIGFFGEKNKALTNDFTLDETENYGDIILDISVPDTSGKQYLVQLMNEKKDQVFSTDTLSRNRKISYRQYPGGRYLIRIVHDRNRNGRWDPGNVHDIVQPERIWYFDKAITIRSNWEQEEIINIPSSILSGTP